MSRLHWMVVLGYLQPSNLTCCVCWYPKCPDQIGATYPDSLQAVQGSCAVLPCTFTFPSGVSDTNGIVAIWFKEVDTQPITIFHSKSPETIDARFQSRTELLGDPLTRNCTLLLRHLRTQDGGKYSFRFEVVKANSWTEKKQLQLTVTGVLTEGDSETFKCSSPYVCPYDHSSLRWFGYDPKTSSVSGTVQLDTTTAISKQTLQTTLTWKNHLGKLVCEISVGTKKARGEITLHVGHAPRGLKVIIQPPSQNIRVGDTVSLICNISSSYPEPTTFWWFKDGTPCGTEQVPGQDQQEIHYSWFKNNIWFKEGSARILTLEEAIASDTGYYTCKVQNNKGSETSSVLGLTVFYPPRPPSLALFQEIQRGQLAIVHCTVDSNPQSTLSLFREQRLLATTSSHLAPNQRINIVATHNSLKLEIQKIMPEDEGEYQCMATN
ncbi:hypothetical protein L345_16769, partial [Ophiophagus hannah]